MNRSHLWKFILIVLIVLWSVYEIYPPTGRDLTLEFKTRAFNHDATFTNIVSRLDELQRGKSERPFNNLVEAVGTNDITKYFPNYPEAKAETKPTLYILNQLQRRAAGKIKLGLDLQGGTSFLVEMDTNRLDNPGAARAALSQAVEVLRKRVDKLGVAEPLIQPQGNDRILIQLPGLSQ